MVLCIIGFNSLNFSISFPPPWPKFIEPPPEPSKTEETSLARDLYL